MFVSWQVVVGPDMVLSPGVKITLEKQREDDSDFGMEQLSLEEKSALEQGGGEFNFASLFYDVFSSLSLAESSCFLNSIQMRDDESQVSFPYELVTSWILNRKEHFKVNDKRNSVTKRVQELKLEQAISFLCKFMTTEGKSNWWPETVHQALSFNSCLVYQNLKGLKSFLCPLAILLLVYRIGSLLQFTCLSILRIPKGLRAKGWNACMWKLFSLSTIEWQFRCFGC